MKNCLILILFFIISCKTLDFSKNEKNVEEFKLKNGIKVIYKHEPSVEVVSFRVAFKGGVNLLDRSDAGVESLLMELALKGTKVYPKEKLNTMFFKHGISIQPLNQADFSVYRVKILKKYFPIGLHILNDVIKYPLLEKQEFTVLKEKMLAYLRAEEDRPFSQASKLAKDYLFEEHPYYLREAGRIESVSQINVDTVKQHHKKMLDASRILIVVVGNLDRNELKSSLENYFGDIPDKKSDYKIIKQFKNAEMPKTIFKNRIEVPQTIIIGVFGAPNYSSKDFEPMLLGLDIMYERIRQEIRVKRGLVYSPYTAISGRITNFGYLSFSTRNPKEAYEEIKKIIENMKLKKVTEEELSATKELLITSYWAENETVSSQGGNLAFFELVANGYTRYFDHMDRVFRVTPQDIKRVLNQYYKNLTFSVVGNTNNLKPTDFVLK